MASVIRMKRKKGDAYYIAYRLKIDGKVVQRKLRCKNKADAYHRLPDVQQAENDNREYSAYESPNYLKLVTTVSELVDAYLTHHAKELSASTLSNYTHISNHYIKPYIGNMLLMHVTTAFLQRYYDDLPNHPAVQGNHKTPAGNISARTVREVHKVLRPAFAWG